MADKKADVQALADIIHGKFTNEQKKLLTEFFANENLVTIMKTFFMRHHFMQSDEDYLVERPIDNWVFGIDRNLSPEDYKQAIEDHLKYCEEINVSWTALERASRGVKEAKEPKINGAE